ncbi:MAG: hypothetical protein ACI8S6_004460 [Myxococcota bacterium]|jgi:hypothetical protein
MLWLYMPAVLLVLVDLFDTGGSPGDHAQGRGKQRLDTPLSGQHQSGVQLRSYYTSLQPSEP